MNSLKSVPFIDINGGNTLIIKNYLPPKPKTIEDVPKDELLKMAALLFIIGRLAWDYADTVLDLASQMKLGGETKRISRTIREIRRRWEIFRQKDFDSSHDRKEYDLAMLFEELTRRHLNRLCNAIRVEVSKRYELTDEQIMLVQAVMQTLCVYDAMKMYAGQCDRFIKAYYPTAPHSIMPDEFPQMARLIPRFIPDYYYQSESKELTSRILLNEINSIDVVNDERFDDAELIVVDNDKKYKNV